MGVLRHAVVFAKELTVMPQRSVTIKMPRVRVPHQGRNDRGHHVSTPPMIRFGEMTEDELFVTADAVAAVCATNLSDAEPLVI